MQKGKVYKKQVPYFGDMVHVTQIISSEYWKVKHVISYLQNMIFFTIWVETNVMYDYVYLDFIIEIFYCLKLLKDFGTDHQASTLTYFSTCPFGQLTKKSTCPTQSFSCPKKLIKITKTRESLSRVPTTFKLEGEVTSLSDSSQGEVGRLLGEVNCD
jgi:hypothetical protein